MLYSLANKLRVSGTVLLVISATSVTVSCRGSARATDERAIPASPPDATLLVAPGSLGGATTARKQPSPPVISGVLEYCAEALGLSTSEKDIHRDDSVAKEQAKFLDRDLNVASLRRRSGVAFANLIQAVDTKRIHIGVVALLFQVCKDRDAAFDALSETHRDTFNVAALGVFRTFRRENALVILFSETPFHPKVRALLDSAADRAPGSANCE